MRTTDGTLGRGKVAPGLGDAGRLGNRLTPGLGDVGRPDMRCPASLLLLLLIAFVLHTDQFLIFMRYATQLREEHEQRKERVERERVASESSQTRFRFGLGMELGVGASAFDLSLPPSDVKENSKMSSSAEAEAQEKSERESVEVPLHDPYDTSKPGTRTHHCQFTISS